MVCLMEADVLHACMSQRLLVLHAKDEILSTRGARMRIACAWHGRCHHAQVRMQ